MQLWGRTAWVPILALLPADRVTLNTCLQLRESRTLGVYREDWTHLPGLP